ARETSRIRGHLKDPREGGRSAPAMRFVAPSRMGWNCSGIWSYSVARAAGKSRSHTANPAAPTGLICTMNADIRDCLPPVAETRKPNVALPRGSIDTHVHVFEQRYKLSPGRGYNPPDSTLADLEKLHATLGIDRVVFTQPSVYGTDNSAILDGM